MTKNKKAQKKTAVATAAHLEHRDGKHHVVGIGNIRVLIVPDGKFFFAQGLEIDYAAQGSSVKDAQKCFEDGLEKTIDQHLKIHGDIGKLLKVAPSEIWEVALRQKDSIKLYSQVSFHEIERNARGVGVLPYDGLNFYVPDKVAA